MKLQVLVATMNQKDFSLVKKMNISSDVVFANQGGCFNYEEYIFGNCKAKMISTDTIGVGLNRNIAICYSDADILLFSDDDVTYSTGYEKRVIDAFEKNKNADAVIFNMKLTKNGEVFRQTCHKNGKLFWWKALKYGTCVLAVKKTSILKYNSKFSELFGGGCIYSSGEDSLFILDLFRKGAKIYVDDYMLGECAQDESSWFTGYQEKYFYDKGAWIACAFPKSKHIIKWYFIIRFASCTELSLVNIYRHISKGIQGFSKLEVYEETMF